MKYWILGWALLAGLALQAQSAKNVQRLGQLTYQEDLSDIWGYTAPDGKEYALVGVYDGFSLVDVSNPSQPTELFFEPGPPTIWRDVKVWDGYAYVTNENQNGGGLMIANLNHLPDSMPVTYWTGSGNVQFQSSHNIFIDEKGYGYIVGANYGRGGAIIVDLFTTPGQPILETVYDHAYIHDIYVRGDTMWTAEIYRGWFAAVDISDKSPATVPASKIMATQETPFTFTHNLWLSDDGTTLFTTDERSNAPVAAYDVSDLGNIQYLDEIRSSPGSGVIPHNSFVDGDFVVTAYYRDGLQIVDASVPDNLVETGHYDSSPLVGDGFNGAWGVYPYLPSGNYLVTDIEEGLFVLSPEFVYAARLEGVVRDSITGAPLQGARVNVLGPDTLQETTSIIGAYKTGFADSGSVTLQVDKIGYEPKTLTGIRIDNGQTSIADVDLVPLPTFSVSGQVLDAFTDQPVAQSTVQLVSEDTTFTQQTDGNGNFQFPAVFTAEYIVRVGKWGYRTRELDISVEPGKDYTFLLTPGYYDDFVMDFGWTVQSTASTGTWERAIPIGTNLNPNVLIQTDEDVDTDIGDYCYVTGNAGTGIGDDDIDDGTTSMQSPPFDASGMTQPTIRFDYWFISALGAGGSANDSLVAVLDNGTQQATVVIATPLQPQNSWNNFTLDIQQHLNASANMTITFVAEDQDPGHVVEAAIDKFELYDAAATPSVAFDGTPLSDCAPLTVQLFDISSGQVTAWKWLAPGSNEGSSNQQEPVFTFDQPGSYDVTLIATNAVGNDTLIKTDYIEALGGPEVTLGSQSSTGTSDGEAWVTVDNGTPPYTYNWNTAFGVNQDTITGLVPGWYRVTITDGNGCTTIDSIEVTLSTGLSTTANGLGMRVAPNPFAQQAQLLLDKPLATEAQLRLFGVTGQLMAQDVLAAGAQQWRLPALPQGGVYLLEVVSANQRQTFRLLFTP